MLEYSEISVYNIKSLAEMYVETFNSEPWKEKWTMETAEKRLYQMINVEDFLGISVHQDGVLCGMILGSKEQFYDGVVFNIKEFCIRNEIRGKGIGSQIFKEFENRLKIDGVNKVILLTSKGEYTEHFYHKQGLESYNWLTLMGKEL